LRVGAAQIDITPDGPIELSGFAARTQPSDGVLDRLFAKSLYLEDETGQRFIWLHADLIAFHQPFVKEFRAWAADQLHIPPANVLLSTTHPAKVAAIAARHGVEAPVVGVTIEKGMEIRQRGNTLGSWDIAALSAAHEGALVSHVR